LKSLQGIDCMEHTHIISAALLRVVRKEDTLVLKKGCLDLYTVKAGCRLPVWVLVD